MRDEPGFEQAAAALGDRLRIIDQPNLGGSGGYARIMYEALEHTDCEQILYMDDDILLEPDSVLRAVAFSRFSREPMLVGGQMLSLQARSQLSTMGEVVDRNTFLWRNAPRHRAAPRPGRAAPAPDAVAAPAHRRRLQRLVDVPDPAGRSPRTSGMPLPLFIKWDDAEYGLRARARGYRTATVPGIAIWHMSFLEKDDTSDWQAYFHYRNRFVAAALHGPGQPQRAAARHAQAHAAAPDAHGVLGGGAAGDGDARLPRRPGALFPKLPTVLGEIRAKRAEYDDGRPLDSATQVPLSELDALAAQVFPEPPTGKVAIVKGLAGGVLHNLRSARPGAPGGAAAQRAVAATPSGSCCPGSTRPRSSTPDGRGVTFRRRDPAHVPGHAQARGGAATGTSAKAWPDLRRRYRAAMPELTSREAWAREVFDRKS